MAAAVGKHWVMLVSGSKDWTSYRHQADVCHAYQIMRQNGIPDSQIVVMMYDDIANNKENPNPGEIISEPNGVNVYVNVPKDYTGQDVTPENFLAVLRGDECAMRKNGPRKIIKSGGNDTIFIYLSDHGSSGLFCFPERRALYASDLITTIKQMAKNNRFSKMVIYMEACHSGSMFTQLPSDINVYAVTASNPIESSYACYLDFKRNTYLSNEFSSLWMHYTEKCDLNKATFQDQFDYLQKMKKQSEFCCFGDMKIRQYPISELLKNTPQNVQVKTNAQELLLTDLTANHEVPFKILEHRIEKETDAGKKQVLEKELEALHQAMTKIRRAVEAVHQSFFPSLSWFPGLSWFPRLSWFPSLSWFPGLSWFLGSFNYAIDLCELKTVAEHFRTETCSDLPEEQFEIALYHMHAFAHLCAHGVKAERIKEAITTVWKK